jgi:hypothetical protein
VARGRVSNDFRRRESNSRAPNGGGVAWFIVDHKDDLGLKTVKSVRVFKRPGEDAKGNYEDLYMVMFTIVPYTGKIKGKRDSFGLDESLWEYQI